MRKVLYVASNYHTASNDLTLDVQWKDLGFQASITLLISTNLQMNLQMLSIQ